MLDFFTIFSKGGIVLWYIQNTNNVITSSINALIKSVILQERVGNEAFIDNSFAIKYHMDNEFELVFVVGYQKVLQLSYVDKFLTALALEFRDKYKDDLIGRNMSRNFGGFTDVYNILLKEAEEQSREEMKKGRQMRSFDESTKSKKTVASLIVTPPAGSKSATKDSPGGNKAAGKGTKQVETISVSPTQECEIDAETLEQNRLKLLNKMGGKKKAKLSPSPDNSSPIATSTKRVKENRKWAGKGSAKEVAALDYSNTKNENGGNPDKMVVLGENEVAELQRLRGQMRGELGDIEVESSDEESEEEEEIVENLSSKTQQETTKKSNGGMFSLLRNLVPTGRGKALTREDMNPVLEQLRDRLIAKNVAVDIAHRLMENVATKMEGVQLSTFERVAGRVRSALEETCTQLLASKRRLDILRDVMDAKRQNRPYVITFCGVNGVGKSTNLAKIAFWLIEKEFRVLIAACDTFRSGAVEQLRTHVQRLNFIHPPDLHHGQQMVELYEKGYGKDSAAIAMSAINTARDHKFDVVLVDTAGRMQDNEPLMRSLAKLIVVNSPDLVLFVGEALVGNEAVDQLVKFNQALADNSQTENPHTIDGIVLTKFDTIDDKVGAAVSMTYISGQPIVFVGTGQTYADLRQLSASAVVKALMK